MTVILTIVLYADVVDYNVDDFTSPFMPLENLNDEERKWSPVMVKDHAFGNI